MCVTVSDKILIFKIACMRPPNDCDCVSLCKFEDMRLVNKVYATVNSATKETCQKACMKEQSKGYFHLRSWWGGPCSNILIFFMPPPPILFFSSTPVYFSRQSTPVKIYIRAIPPYKKKYVRQRFN